MIEKSINKFIIIAYARTRSNHLISLLNQHPDIGCEAELFYDAYLTEEKVKYLASLSKIEIDISLFQNELIELRNRNPLGYMEWIYSLLANKGPVIGFKIFPEQNSQILDYVLNDQSIRKIILIRNFLFSHISLKQSVQTKEWYLNKGEKGIQSKVIFYKEPFLQYLKKRINYLQSIIEQLERTGQKYFLCFSEDIGKEDWWEEIYKFLGISLMIKTKSVYIKQNPNYLEERVLNYQEMVRQLMYTKCKELLYGDFFLDRQKWLVDLIPEDEKSENYSIERYLQLKKECLVLQMELKKFKARNIALENKVSILTNSISFRTGYFLTRIPAMMISIFKRKKYNDLDKGLAGGI